MRWPSPFRSRYRRWWLAFVASVALHAAFLAAVRPGATDARPPRPPAIDSRVDGPLTLHLVDPPEIVAPVRVAVRTPPEPRRLPETVREPDPTPPPGPEAPVLPVAATSLPVAPSPVREGGSESDKTPPIPSAATRGGDLPAVGRTLHKPLPAGARVVYLLDRSGSMSQGDRLRLAVTCIRRSLRELKPDTWFAVVVYHSRAECLPPGATTDLVRGTPENVRKVEAALEELIAEGSSAHMDGMRKALGLKPDAVMLLTDADDLPGEMVELMLTMCGKTRIFPVIFGSDYATDAASSLKALAAGSRGIVGSVPLPTTVRE